MKIVGLFLNNEMRTGANRRYLELMESLAEKGHDVSVIMNSILPYEPRHFTRIEIPVRYRRKGFPPASYLFAKAIAKNAPALRERLGENGARVDWIHIHGDIHFAAAVKLKKLVGGKIFFAFRCNDITRACILRKTRGYNAKEYILSFLYNAKDRLRERQIAKQSALITFQNGPDRDIFAARVGVPGAAEKTVIIPGNIGLPRFTPETAGTNVSASVRSLVYVGSVSLSKGLQYLFEALAELVRRGHTDLRLSVLGKISDQGVYSMVEKLGIKELVSFEGYTQPFPFLAKCDLMVYPTLYDAFPDTILEALHAGCPVIATRVGGIPEMLVRDELLFDQANVAQIADRIERCVNDGAFYRELRRFCAERAEYYKFDWAERFVEAMTASNV